MRILDLREMERRSVLEADLCIIGSGPAGLSIANEFVGTRTEVLVLESGGREYEADTQALYEIESTGVSRILDQDVLRNRVLGGTSQTWSGRCAPFDAIDFERRSWVPWSGWPVTREGLDPYIERAGRYLGLGPNQYDETLWSRFGVDPPSPPLRSLTLRPMFWQFSKRPVNKDHMRFGQDWIQSDAPNIRIVLHANATHINLTSGGGQLESIEISTLEGKRCIVKSRAVVLCCGGIENARLLLASNRIFSRGVGNQNDMVGRFLMDHTSVRVGRFELSQSFELRSRFGAYWLDDERGRHHYLHGFGLSREAQENEHLLNCHAHISGFVHPEANPWTALGRLKSSMKSARISASDVRVVFNHLGEVVKGLSRRQFKHRPEIASVQSLWLELMVEQIPDPWSRVTLSPDKKDALGMPLSSLHWKLSDSERMTASRLIASVCEELKHLGLPPLNGIQQLDDYSQWVSLCYERAHPAGTTRMSSYPRDGVVDANCQVHEVEGLFVAGSSVFPTSGAANPTLMVVAIALRVADYLKAHIRKANVRSVDTRFPLVDESVKAGMA